MSEIKNQEQLEGVGAAYTMLKTLFESMIANAEVKRVQAVAKRSVRGLTFCDTSIQFFRRCIELIDEEFTEFLPFEPLPLDEKGEPYLPESEGILALNVEVTRGKRLGADFFGEDKKNDDLADN
jgi:hypothetical protein